MSCSWPGALLWGLAGGPGAPHLCSPQVQGANEGRGGCRQGLQASSVLLWQPEGQGGQGSSATVCCWRCCCCCPCLPLPLLLRWRHPPPPTTTSPMKKAHSLALPQAAGSSALTQCSATATLSAFRHPLSTLPRVRQARPLTRPCMRTAKHSWSSVRKQDGASMWV